MSQGFPLYWSKIQIPGWLSISSGPDLTVLPSANKSLSGCAAPSTLPKDLCAPCPEHPESDYPALSQPLVATDLTQASPLVASLPLTCMSQVIFDYPSTHSMACSFVFFFLGAHSVRRGVLSARVRLVW